MPNTKNNKLIYTIGHSTLPEEDFLAELKAFNVKHLVDVRHFPGSRKFPQYNKEVLQQFVEGNNIKYTWLEDLGGRRKLDKNAPETKWNHPAFKGYAQYMHTAEFKKGIKALEKIANKEATAIMCSEAVWWRCHRSMVSDYLKFNGWEVEHIMSKTKIAEHPYTQPASVLDHELSYAKDAVPLRT